MSQALATITPQSRRPHQTFRVGYDMPAREFETAADVLAASRAVHERMRAKAPPVAPAVSPQVAASNARVALDQREHEYLFIRSKCAGDHIARTGGIWRKSEETAILTETALKHGVSVAQIEGQTRKRDVVAARFEVYNRMHKELGYSLPMIGKAVGNRDHSGVMHGILRHEAAMRGEFYRRTRPRASGKATNG